MAANAAVSHVTRRLSTLSMSSPNCQRVPGLPPLPPPHLSVPPSISHGSCTSSIAGIACWRIGVPVVKCAVGKEPDPRPHDASVPTQGNGGVPRIIGLQGVGSGGGVGVLKVLRSANSVLPHVVLGSTVLALAYPPSFTWFTTMYYAPALGFLMFAVGVNSNPKDFLEAIKRPRVIFIGYVGQFIVKPMLGCLFGTISTKAFHLSNSIGAGIMLTSCVSGAQLSNYATFLTDPSMAPLSIVMTSISTATAALMTPTLSFLLIGKRLPVDVKGMMSSIIQIVVAPIAAGLLLNRFLPRVCAAIQPLLPPLSVLVTSLCVGSPLAINMKSIVSPFGITILLLVFGFHASSFVAGYFLTGVVFKNMPDLEALKRTLSFETGMQSSLLALALANKFFHDPLVGVPPAISVVIMSLMGFVLVMVWSNSKQQSTGSRGNGFKGKGWS